MDTNEVLQFSQECKKRWKVCGEDERFIYFEKAIPDFINEYNDDEQNLMIELIKQFVYYPHAIINQLICELHSKVLALNGFNLQRAIFGVIKSSDGKINSSTDYISDYRRLNHVSKHSIITDIGDVPYEDWQEISTIVLIDDFGGSGTTINTFLNKYKKKLEKKKVIYAVIHIMSEAKKIIENEAHRLSINFVVVSIYESSKSFTGTRSDEEKQAFIKASNKVGFTKNFEIWGFENTEALVAFYNNTPNNTLGVFRLNSERNVAVFPREDDEIPEWKRMANERKARGYNNYRRGKKQYNG